VQAVAALLLERGASAARADADGRTPAAAALELAAPELIALLARHGAAPPADALPRVLVADHDEANERTVRQLLAALQGGAARAAARGRDSFGRTPLHRAAESPGRLYLARWLLEHGAEPDARDGEATTPLATAALRGNVPALELLHARGASLAAVTADGQTLLHLAAYGPSRPALRWLSERRLPLDARDRWGRRALDVALDTRWFAFASEADRLEVVTRLGGTRADLARGRTHGHPLHVAMREHDLAAVKRLLEGGADANVRDEDGATPLRVALDRSVPSLNTPRVRAFGEGAVRLLLRHGADTSARIPTTMQTLAEHARALRLEGLLRR
jgi:ankyrin repeat protein